MVVPGLYFLRQTIPRETPTLMKLIDKDTCFHTGVFIHNLFCFHYARRKYPYPAEIATVVYTTDDRQLSACTEYKIAPTMFIYDIVYARFMPFGASLKDNHTILLRGREQLTHGLITNFLHHQAILFYHLP